jgi:hypothetical protein
VNSRDKGRRGEIELAKILAPYWPGCIRNLDQFGDDKRDLCNVPGMHWQAKRVEKINVWEALDQTVTEAASTDLPILAFRRNWTKSPLPSRSLWFAALELDELIPLLRLRES